MADTTVNRAALESASNACGHAAHAAMHMEATGAFIDGLNLAARILREQARITALTNDQVICMAEAMRTYGGGWAASMADAIDRADSNNRARLLAAFPELAARYGPGSGFDKPDASALSIYPASRPVEAGGQAAAPDDPMADEKERRTFASAVGAPVMVITGMPRK